MFASQQQGEVSMSVVAIEAVRRQRETEVGESDFVSRPQLVLVPTGRAAVRAARAARPRMRLTRFGRLVVTLFVGAVVLALGIGLAGQLASATGAPRTITVESGQTLSGIAARELPGLPVREGVVELQLANSLSTSMIHTGQRLVIPAP
jgi:hypothetical protein